MSAVIEYDSCLWQNNISHEVMEVQLPEKYNWKWLIENPKFTLT